MLVGKRFIHPLYNKPKSFTYFNEKFGLSMYLRNEMGDEHNNLGQCRYNWQTFIYNTAKGWSIV